MQHRKGAVPTMLLIAAILAGFGVWQFGDIGLNAGEEREEEYARRGEGTLAPGDMPATLARIAGEYGGRIVETEREHEDGREVYEIKLVDADGNRRKVLVDAATGEVLGGGRH